MPQSAERKAEYQRQRRKTETGSGRTDIAKAAALADDSGHEHYWLRRDDQVVCTAFEMQRRQIGGCGETRKWDGKLISPRPDGSPELAVAIIDSPYYKKIQAAMPVTKART